MACCSHNPRTSSPPPSPPPANRKEEILLQIPNATVHLTGDQDIGTIKLGRGDFAVFRVTDGLPLATIIKVGEDLRWPLTKDEPVVKLGQLHYLFTILDKDGSFLNYGVSFARADSQLASFDQFLKENACFSVAPAADYSLPAKSYEMYWKDYAPNIEDYNGVLAKAIAQGTGEIVKGIFKLSNSYTTQVQKGASLMQPQAAGAKTGASVVGNKKCGGMNKTLRRVRKLSEMTEKMSQRLLNGVLAVTGSVAAPLVRSKAGKAFFDAGPGEVLLASMDAVAKVLDAAEVAERRALTATSGAVAVVVSKRFGESAGKAADDVFATAGHTIGTAWNVFKIRNAINPKYSIRSTIVNNAGRKPT